MNRAGMTLLEMLLALALLSAIIAASAAWMQIAAELAAPSGAFAAQRQMLAVDAAFDLIQQDLNVGDFQPQRDSRIPSKPPRVTVSGDKLTIRTRVSESGAVEHAYQRDISTNQLVLVQRATDSKQTRSLIDQT